MKKETIAIGLLVVAGIGAILYFLYQKGKKTNAKADALTEDAVSKNATTKQETSQFKELVNVFKKWDAGALSYMLPAVDELMSGERDIHPDYLIKGKVTLPGAFVAVFDSSWKSNADQWKELHAIFNKIKASYYGV